MNKSNLAFSKTHYDHELRKKARELEKMKDRLAKIMSERTQSTIKFKLANPLPKVIKGAKDPKLTTEQKDQDVMIKIILGDYENREKHVMVENQRLRELLALMYTRVERACQQISRHMGHNMVIPLI